MALKKLTSELYLPVVTSGDVDFQKKHLDMPITEITQDEFISTVFGDFSGHLCIFQKFSDGRTRNVFYKKNEIKRMETFLKKTFGVDTYISYSTYFRRYKKHKKDKLRTQSNVDKTYMVVQDLDYYKDGISDAEVLRKIGKMIKDGVIVCPTYIISTGQGYQLIWLVEPFKNIKGFVNDRDWHVIQEHLYQLFEPFNSDSVVKNPSAVTRLVGTKHRKSGNKVYGYKTNQAKLNLKDFIFFHDLIPTSDRKVKPTKKPIKQVSRMVSTWNAYTLNRQREEDIFTYVRVQNERNKSYIGIRNWLGLVLRFHSLVSTDGDTEYAQKRVISLCDEMDMTDTSKNEILRRSEPAERYYHEWKNDTWDREKYVRGGLFYTNARILDLMNITEDYYIQWKMKTIKIKNNKYEAARKRFERLEKGQVKGTMQEYNEKRKEKAEDKLRLLQKAIEIDPEASNYKLADLLNISEPYVRKLKKKL